MKHRWLSVLLVALGMPAQAQVVIKLGTVAPEGSIWHDILLEMRERWEQISAGQVELRIYAGGVLGGEDEMIRKMQRRGLDALAISGSGLPLIDRIVDCIQMPLMFEDYAQLDLVRNGLAADLEAGFRHKGYEVLSWSEAGWVHFFGKEPVRTPEDLRRLRLWIAAGDPSFENIARELNFRVVPLPVTDMLTGLQTGLIEVIDVPPLFALLDRSYEAAPFMTDLRFAPVNAATVITATAWDRIPEQYHEPLRLASRELSAKLRTQVDRFERDAIEEMVSRGLQVVELDEASRQAWRREAENVYAQLACQREYPALYERVLQLHAAPPGAG
jgi:TRAP-type C4-dicarboxylate transport system substrate-binding protein